MARKEERNETKRRRRRRTHHCAVRTEGEEQGDGGGKTGIQSPSSTSHSRSLRLSLRLGVAVSALHFPIPPNPLSTLTQRGSTSRRGVRKRATAPLPSSPRFFCFPSLPLVRPSQSTLFLLPSKDGVRRRLGGETLSPHRLDSKIRDGIGLNVPFPSVILLLPFLLLANKKGEGVCARPETPDRTSRKKGGDATVCSPALSAVALSAFFFLLSIRCTALLLLLLLLPFFSNLPSEVSARPSPAMPSPRQHSLPISPSTFLGVCLVRPWEGRGGAGRRARKGGGHEENVAGRRLSPPPLFPRSRPTPRPPLSFLCPLRTRHRLIELTA